MKTIDTNELRAIEGGGWRLCYEPFSPVPRVVAPGQWCFGLAIEL
ncbi:MAG TPA: ComC/BlpC family leader-containing pheromone/bacteriocin [Haliangiales bacterium]|nr:ComC/BlpC family leader-containing pheromone/bacteriocin [Haliangiales bacterium]